MSAARRLNDERGQLSPAEAELAAEKFPERLAITEAEWNSGARVADDCFCQCCGARGVLSHLCPSCERSNR